MSKASRGSEQVPPALTQGLLPFTQPEAGTPPLKLVPAGPDSPGFGETEGQSRLGLSSLDEGWDGAGLPPPRPSPSPTRLARSPPAPRAPLTRPRAAGLLVPPLSHGRDSLFALLPPRRPLSLPHCRPRPALNEAPLPAGPRQGAALPGRAGRLV